ncbi:YjiH family protein [Tepidimicrobium xylanilyticum]|uniref:Nucleoside recognition GATE domain-containing membrane protein YjiH n=1 Tax=Tepidimicrobium xylanilyticum TaxID=1123352 RepID=A0A1H2RQL5_9FIRM|nr:YjiH family protein [Tepidimicrobium xylanilyticum]SDW20919.1 nucleoside recognition GATE domain-containing membrane protein YjiH [Tepidimicrobium xylanilyticum]
MHNSFERRRFTVSDYLKFIVPSVIGVLLLMFPLKVEGQTTILVALLASTLTGLLEPILPTIILVIIALSGIMAVIYRFFKPAFIENNEFLKSLFSISDFWIAARVVGVILTFLVYFKIGPEYIWSEDTGGLILYDLILGLFSIFFFAGFILPFLTNFGLLEFIGAMITPVMRPIFQLPGRSAIDCIASWVGDGTIGVVITNKQYEEGYYTTKEASVIATTFSAVSITFCLVVLNQVGLAHLFGPYYLAVTLASVIAAIIIPRVPPLSRKKDDYFTGLKRDLGEDIPDGFTTISWGTHLAINRAEQSMNVKHFVTNGITTVLDMWMGVMPVIMAFGTIALIIAEATPVFVWLGKPFIPLLNLLRVPYAVEASQTMVVGFADMFLPSVIGATIPNEMTRFVVAAVSVTQLVYLSEVGAVILGSKIPVSLGELFIIFIERTLITLPIVAIIAHLIF